MPITDLPKHLRKPLLDLLAAGGRVARDGSRVLIDGPPALADALHAHAEPLAQHVVPSVSADEAELVRSLLADAGASVAYITSPSAARQAVAEIRASAPDVVGLDFETEVLPAFRQPIPIKFTKDGNLAAQTAARWRGRCSARSISFQGASGPSLGGRRALLRLRYAVRCLGGHRVLVRTAAGHLQCGI